MARGQLLTKDIRSLIYRTHKKHPSWPARKIRGKVISQWHKVSQNYDDPNWPGLSAVQKLLTKYHEKDEERSFESKSLDEPWSLGSLAEYPLPPEAMPLVISIYEKCLLEATSERWLFSIREALWVGRLHKIIELHHSRHILPLPNAQEEALRLKLGHRPEGYQKIKLEDLVLEWAYVFAGYEILSETEGESFDSRELDGYMMANVFDYYGERREDFIEEIAEEYGADEVKLRVLNLSIGDIERAAMSGKYKKEAQNERPHSQEVQE